MMKSFLLVATFLWLLPKLNAQDEQVWEPERKGKLVNQFKPELKLTFLMDSVIVGKKSYTLNLKNTTQIEYESDYIQVFGDYYIKIFISRNQEYGEKFYGWRWDYLKKTGSTFTKIGYNYYSRIEYDKPMPSKFTSGSGFGTEGEKDYLMIYYRYRIE